MARWRPIEDLEDDPRSLTDGELDALRRVWAAQKNDVLERGALEEFDKRLRREWAIETGIIENVYALDRGVTKTLIEKGIDAALIPHGASNKDSTAVARIIQDHYEALAGMLDFVARQRPLSTSYVKELHAALLRNQESYTAVDQFGQAFEKRLEKGEYKNASNSPTRPDGSIHEYCPPEHVASEMDRLISIHAEHDERGVPIEVESAWLHHRFTQIHPFSDGNGRVARSLASLVFIKSGLFPLIVGRDDRTRYIDALESADSGNLKPLILMFVEAQRGVLILATEAAGDTRPALTTEQAITAARDRLVQRRKVPIAEWVAAKDVADELANAAARRLQEVARSLELAIEKPGSSGFAFRAWLNNGIDEGARQKAVREARQTADFGAYCSSVVLSLQTGEDETLALSLHALGPKFRGLIGVLGFVASRNTEPVVIDSFQINYEEDLATAQARFTPWLERVIVEGLNLWRRTL